MTLDEVLKGMALRLHGATLSSKSPLVLTQNEREIQVKWLATIGDASALLSALRKAIQQRDGYMETACALGGCDTEDFGRFKERNEAELASILKGEG